MFVAITIFLIVDASANMNNALYVTVHQNLIPVVWGANLAGRCVCGVEAPPKPDRRGPGGKPRRLGSRHSE